MRSLPRIASTLIALALAGLAVLAASAPAQAADYYRYWSYFHVESGGYTYSDQGIGSVKPADGAVEAFRFAASSEDAPNLPRVDPATATFSAICGDDDAEAGEKRVAVIIDYGIEQDADGQTLPPPEAECADVPSDATTLQVLQDLGDVRSKSSSFGPTLCAIDGYPTRGCADVITKTPTTADGPFLPVELENASASPSASAVPSSADASASESGLPSPGSSGNTGQDKNQDTEQGRGADPWAYLGLGAALFAILGGGVYLANRRRRG